jgi:hypothetical protein
MSLPLRARLGHSLVTRPGRWVGCLALLNEDEDEDEGEARVVRVCLGSTSLCGGFFIMDERGWRGAGTGPRTYRPRFSPRHQTVPPATLAAARLGVAWQLGTYAGLPRRYNATCILPRWTSAQWVRISHFRPPDTCGVTTWLLLSHGGDESHRPDVMSDLSVCDCPLVLPIVPSMPIVTRPDEMRRRDDVTMLSRAQVATEHVNKAAL